MPALLCARPPSGRALSGSLLHSRYWIAAVLFLLLSSQALADADKESAVRAAFLYRLAFFVQWPDEAFDTPDSAIRFCIAGTRDSGVAQSLGSQARGRKVMERPVDVRLLDANETASACHIVYLEAGRALPEGLAAHSLVVVDSLSALEHGNLALVSSEQSSGEVRLAFVSRRDRLLNTQFNLSAKLLQLVRFEGAPG